MPCSLTNAIPRKKGLTKRPNNARPISANHRDSFTGPDRRAPVERRDRRFYETNPVWGRRLQNFPQPDFLPVTPKSIRPLYRWRVTRSKQARFSRKGHNSFVVGRVYVAKTPFASLKQPSPRNSDGGDLPNEDVMPVAHRDSGSRAVSRAACLCPIHRECDRRDSSRDNPVQGASDGTHGER
jgi:hypothetical protein